MSTEIGTIKGLYTNDLWLGLQDKIYITRFHAGLQHGPCHQITVGDQYIQLDNKGAMELIHTLLSSILLEESES